MSKVTLQKKCTSLTTPSNLVNELGNSLRLNEVGEIDPILAMHACQNATYSGNGGLGLFRWNRSHNSNMEDVGPRYRDRYRSTSKLGKASMLASMSATALLAGCITAAACNICQHCKYASMRTTHAPIALQLQMA